ncbi:MAG: ATP-binding protein [Candidatus Saccharibacteria bacterium]
MYIHIPPSGEDLVANGRDERDVTEEVLSQAQVMYNIMSSTVTKGFKSRIYGQRHLSFEIIVHEGLIHYYAVVPIILVDVVKQAISAAYPTARLEEVEERNIFNQSGKVSGTIGGEFTLKKSYVYPIATYQESKRDAAVALLNALSVVERDDGIAIQLMIRPAVDSWTKNSVFSANKIKKDKGSKKSGMGNILEALWKAPETKEVKPEDKQLSSLEQGLVDAIEEKTRHPGYETLIRVVASSNTAARSQTLLKNIVAAFSLFDSPVNNGFKFSMTKDIEELITSYIFRFFPQSVNQNILNSVELATVFHLPDQNSIPTSQVQRQMAKQVDGPIEVMEEGVLLGYNEFRGVKKPIRLSTNDRRRHTYFIGQTGTGKSTLLENLAYQDMMDGRGFAFIDPHGDSAEKLLGMVPRERIEDVIYFNPGDIDNPVGLNLFEYENEEQKDLIIQEAMAMLYKLYDPNRQGMIGARFEHIFTNCAQLLMADPKGGTFVDIPKLLIDKEFREDKLQYIKDQNVIDFWTKEWADSQRSNEAGEVTSWVASKFGAFLSNAMMRNIIGQTKSSFNIRQIMDTKKILLINLGKGPMGDLNSSLMGMIFVMKFQTAAMSRANIPEDDREDFSLYVDEFQNLATDSFASILSEARKYRLNLILANQFMTQLTDIIRESVLGNIGTIISGRLGITDAEILQKRFEPIFDAGDLTKLPNYKSITSVMINGVPSAAFSMALPPLMAKTNTQLIDAVKKLSSAKYGCPRALVEKEIFERLGSGDVAKKSKAEAMAQAQQNRLSGQAAFPSLNPITENSQPQAPGGNPASAATPSDKSSFLDNWLAKRQQLQSSAAPNQQSIPPVATIAHNTAPTISAPLQQPVSANMDNMQPIAQVTLNTNSVASKSEELHIRLDGNSDGVAINLRD